MKKKMVEALGVVLGISLSLNAISLAENSVTSLEHIKSSYTYNSKVYVKAEDEITKQESLDFTLNKNNTHLTPKNTLKQTSTKRTIKNSNYKKSNRYGELLDWWESARYIFKIGTVAEVTDLYTGKTFRVKRTMGTNHADCEALTINDTKIMMSIWGGYSWDTRPVIVKVNGRKIAASMSFMPHAGIDSKPAFAVVSSRSGGYGRGENLDVIKGNAMNGHIDIHFFNSTTHKTGKKNPEHQRSVLKAAGK